MTRPADIPEAVWFKAQNAIGFDSGCECDHCCQTQGLAEPVARAIMAETEACAQAADEEERKRLANMRSAQDGSAQWGDPQAAAIAQGHKAVTAMSIAAAIRNRSKQS